MYCPDWVSAYGNGDSSDLVLNCGVTVSFTQSFFYLGSRLHCGLSDHHGVGESINKSVRNFWRASCLRLQLP
jgi:hypothetical protein